MKNIVCLLLFVWAKSWGASASQEEIPSFQAPLKSSSAALPEAIKAEKEPAQRRQRAAVCAADLYGEHMEDGERISILAAVSGIKDFSCRDTIIECFQIFKLDELSDKYVRSLKGTGLRLGWDYPEMVKTLSNILRQVKTPEKLRNILSIGMIFVGEHTCLLTYRNFITTLVDIDEKDREREIIRPLFVALAPIVGHRDDYEPWSTVWAIKQFLEMVKEEDRPKVLERAASMVPLDQSRISRVHSFYIKDFFEKAQMMSEEEYSLLQKWAPFFGNRVHWKERLKIINHIKEKFLQPEKRDLVLTLSITLRPTNDHAWGSDFTELVSGIGDVLMENEIIFEKTEEERALYVSQLESALKKRKREFFKDSMEYRVNALRFLMSLPPEELEKRANPIPETKSQAVAPPKKHSGATAPAFERPRTAETSGISKETIETILGNLRELKADAEAHKKMQPVVVATAAATATARPATSKRPSTAKEMAKRPVWK